MSVKKYKLIEKSINYQFKNQQILIKSLTHRSYGNEHNERMEFLGDALLQSIISIFLYENNKHAEEGELTRLRAAIVKGEQLANVARQIELGKYILLGQGERKSGGQRRDSILANALEALIAAVFLDSDFNTCQQITIALFAPILNNLPTAEMLKDAKTRLQEYLQGNGYPLPVYSVINEEGPEHDRNFYVLLRSIHHSVEACGNSRKKAEQKAADKLLNIYQQRKL